MAINERSVFNKTMGIRPIANQGKNYEEKVSKVMGNEEQKRYNPFLKSDGTLFNEYINYQAVLDDPNVTDTAKEYITEATGLSSTATNASDALGNDMSYEEYADNSEVVNFDSSLDSKSLASLDVATELPKLSTKQISGIISEHFSKSSVIKPSDAKGIYHAQESTGMSALAILGIGALESGYGTSNIAKKKNNLWGWNATNINPLGNATTFSPVSEGATQFAQNYMKTYYNGYGAKSIYSAGTGNNPSKKGYAYNDNGTINPQWATNVGNIMGKFYNTAKSYMSSNTNYSAGSASGRTIKGDSIVSSAKNYIGTPYIWGGESSAEGGFDCSGFVYNVLKDSGYKVNRTTANGYRGYGQKINKSQLQPGDLVFYGKGNHATHIAIYVGNGQIIHSSGGSKNTKSNPGKGVGITSIDYRSDFLEARRY